MLWRQDTCMVVRDIFFSFLFFSFFSFFFSAVFSAFGVLESLGSGI